MRLSEEAKVNSLEKRSKQSKKFPETKEQYQQEREDAKAIHKRQVEEVPGTTALFQATCHSRKAIGG